LNIADKVDYFLNIDYFQGFILWSVYTLFNKFHTISFLMTGLLFIF